MKGSSLSNLAGFFAARGAQLACAAILAGIAYTTASTILFFVPAQQPGAAATPAPAQAGANQPVAPPVDVQAISEANLFGNAKAAAAKQAALDKPAVETRLPLTLIGVFMADAREASAAIIAERNKPELLYQVGDKVPGNATLWSVQADHVVLLRAGVQEALRFPETHEFRRIKGQDEPPAKQRETSLATTRRGQRGSAANPQDFIANFLMRPEPNQEALATRPTMLKEALREGGRPQGFHLGELAQLPYFKQNGLEAGDLIVSLNGQAVADIDMSETALAELLASGPIQLEVQRAGQLLSLTASARP